MGKKFDPVTDKTNWPKNFAVGFASNSIGYLTFNYYPERIVMYNPDRGLPGAPNKTVGNIRLKAWKILE